MFKTAAEVRECAEELMAALNSLPDARGRVWTQANFMRLDAFVASQAQRYPGLKSYYRNYDDRSEFLWDYIASAPELGIFLAAESEQKVSDEGKVQALKHDFEKLLYVYAPIRLLMTKARNRDHAKELSDALATYADRCCLAFNPGAVFILHFSLWYTAEKVCYLWQSDGDPGVAKTEPIHFQAYC